MDALSSVVHATPSWVWILLIYLFLRGLAATRTSVMPFRRLLIIPCALTVWGVASLVSAFGLTAPGMIAWAAGIFVGGLAAVRCFHAPRLRINRSEGLVTLPGTYFVLGVVMVAFIAKYGLDCLLAAMPELTRSGPFIAAEAGILGVVAGLFIGRLWAYYNKYRTHHNNASQALQAAR